MIAVLGSIAAGYAFVSWFGRGDLVVVAPRDEVLTVLIDGEAATVPMGENHTFALARGVRSIVLQTDAGLVEHDVEVVDGLSRFLVAGKNQCFMLVDIAKSHYRREGASVPPPPPRLVTRLYSGDRWKLSGNVYLPGRDPPTVYSGNVSLVLVRELDCEWFGPGIGERAQLEAIGLL
jgi:hypothetical protein